MTPLPDIQSLERTKAAGTEMAQRMLLGSGQLPLMRQAGKAGRAQQFPVTSGPGMAAVSLLKRNSQCPPEMAPYSVKKEGCVKGYTGTFLGIGPEK
jgi:hypothetical protein